MSVTRHFYPRLISILLTASALALTACGGGGGSTDASTAPSTPTSNAPITSPSNPASPGMPSTQDPLSPEDPPTSSTPTNPAGPGIGVMPPSVEPTNPPPSDPADPWAPVNPAPTEPPDQYVPQPLPVYSKQDAMRLLEQATFGPTPQDLAKVSELGIAGYVDAQLSTAKTGYVGLNKTANVQPSDCKTQPNDLDSAASICARTHYSLFELQRQFFANAMSGEDQLRQRVAFALSQIFVVSGTEIKLAAGMADYQNMLLDGAFGNFRDLLQQVTLHPVMGTYLDMANNMKGDPARGTKPNENFARELLQLFTLGTERLNTDGTPMRDANGEPMPTYSQADVEALARVFTGWTYSPWIESKSRWVNGLKLVGPMVAFDSQHDMGAKQVLGTSLPANQSAPVDLDQALDAIFRHPNVGPFIATRLIQHLVTSNPTPEYVARVARVFNHNGSGVRGDLRAVVRAILLDSEARGAIKTDSAYGKLKEPALFMTGFLRSLGGKSDGVYLRAQSAALGQDIFTAPSVFNYYSPLHRIGEGTLYGPEFGIYDGASALTRIDFVYELVYANGVAPDPTVPNSIGTSIDFGAQGGLAQAQATELNERLMFGKLSQSSFDALNAALEQLPADDIEERARAAAYALGVSAQYQIQR